MLTRIALLGATGQTGREVLEILLKQDAATINIYVRSKSKLLGMFPSLETDPKINVFEGNVLDQALFIDLLTNVDTIIFTLGQNDNRPGSQIIEDGARAVISALEEMNARGQKRQEPPRLVFLSSVSWNERKNPPGNTPLMTRIIRQAFYWPYKDLLAGQRILCSRPDLVNVTLMQPGALIEENATGYDLSIDTVGVGISYPDLAAAMVEVALEMRYANVAAILATSKGGYDFGRYAGIILPKVVKGLAASYIPGFWTVHEVVARVFRS